MESRISVIKDEQETIKLIFPYDQAFVDKVRAIIRKEMESRGKVLGPAR